MNGDAIVGAIRGVILGELGSVRTVPAGAFGEGVPSTWPGGDDGARRLLADAKKTFDVHLGLPRRTNAVGPSTASRAVLALDVRVTLTYAITLVADTFDAGHRYAARALASEDALTITQALEWPGNLLVDTEGAVTKLVSGRLGEGAPPRVVREDWTTGVYEVELRYRAHVLEEQPIRIFSPIVTSGGDFLVTHSGDHLVAASAP